MFAHQYAVGKIGQPVVMRHVRDALVCSDAFRDILMRGKPASAGGRMIGNLDQAPVSRLNNRVLSTADRAKNVVAIDFNVSVERAGFPPMPDELAEFDPRLHEI